MFPQRVSYILSFGKRQGNSWDNKQRQLLLWNKPQFQLQIDGTIAKSKIFASLRLFVGFFLQHWKFSFYNFKSLRTSVTFSLDVFLPIHFELKMEKEMAAHSSILAWRILWMEEPGGPLSIGSQRVGHDWSDLACMHWRRKQQPTQVFLPGESQGRMSLVGCHLWGRTELNTSEVT